MQKLYCWLSQLNHHENYIPTDTTVSSKLFKILTLMLHSFVKKEFKLII